MHSRTALGRLAQRGALAVVLCLSGSSFAAAQSQAPSNGTRSALGPPPGRLVDVSGGKLHLHCIGAGAPTVVIEAGAGSWSVQWAHVQKAAAAAGATVCTYDRAGLGWSEPSSRPRRTSVMVDELHGLLHAAGLTQPLILAGHSLGAWNVRAYQRRYPEEVAGLVLLDGAHEQQVTRLPPIAWNLTAMAATATRARADAVRRGEVRESDVSDAGFLALAPDQRPAYVASMLDPGTYEVSAAETALAAVSATDVPPAAPGSLGRLPLVVLSAEDSFGAFAGTPIPRDESNAVWRTMQAELAALSTNAVHLKSPSGHHRIYESDPDAAVEAIRRAVALVRREPPRTGPLGLTAGLLPLTSTPAVDQLLASLETAYRAMDADAFIRHYTEDFSQLDVSRRTHVRGRDTWDEWTRRINSAHSAMGRTHRGRAVVGDWVIVELEWSGTVKPEATGDGNPRTYRYTGLGLLRLRDGRIQQQVFYGDFATFSEQLAGRAMGR